MMLKRLSCFWNCYIRLGEVVHHSICVIDAYETVLLLDLEKMYIKDVIDFRIGWLYNDAKY